jgi:hypothetical protein
VSSTVVQQQSIEAQHRPLPSGQLHADAVLACSQATHCGEKATPCVMHGELPGVCGASDISSSTRDTEFQDRCGAAEGNIQLPPSVEPWYTYHACQEPPVEVSTCNSSTAVVDDAPSRAS